MTPITETIVIQNDDPRYDFSYSASKGDAITDYVELWIKHEGVERLERNIKDPDETITAIVHFLAGTRQVHDYAFYVTNIESGECDPINVDLTIEELNMILEFAWKQIN